MQSRTKRIRVVGQCMQLEIPWFRTSPPLVELPAKAFWKFACGSGIEVFPDKTTQPSHTSQPLCREFSKRDEQTRYYNKQENEDLEQS